MRKLLLRDSKHCNASSRRKKRQLMTNRRRYSAALTSHLTFQSLIEKYGGGECLVKEDKALLMGQNEGYIEYSAKGKVIKGVERKAIKSRYEEDV